MASKNGVLEMGTGKESITFPGPGGYKFEWAPGGVHVSRQSGGVKEDGIPTLHAVDAC